MTTYRDGHLRVLLEGVLKAQCKIRRTSLLRLCKRRLLSTQVTAQPEADVSYAASGLSRAFVAIVGWRLAKSALQFGAIASATRATRGATHTVVIAHRLRWAETGPSAPQKDVGQTGS